MTSLSDGLGPQKDPNSGRTRVESGPAGTHRPTTRRGSGIAQPPAGSLPRVPGAPRVRAGPSHRHARRAAGDRGPWVSLPLRATIPEGHTVGQHARRPIASRAGAEGAGADPRRNGDDYPMTSLSDGLGPQKGPNSGRTRVESGPAGTHRPTTRWMF